jgi:hypothetical protein
MTGNTIDTGPAMRALPNDRWRNFAVLFCGQGRRNAKRAYGVAFENAHEPTQASAACKLIRDDRMQAAILELSQKQLRSLAPEAVAVFQEIATNPQHPHRLQAAKEIADRTGLHAVSETRSTVTRLSSDTDMVKQIGALAAILGIDAQRLLGKQIEAPMIDITPIEEEPELVFVEPEVW